MMEQQSLIANNVHRVLETVHRACSRAQRDPASVTLVAVSKRKPAADVVAAARAGIRHFGENRAEEASQKVPQVLAVLPPELHPTWHMVGHIQSRKAADVASLFQVVHSVDDFKLARRLSEFAQQNSNQPVLDVFLQMNVSGEATKSGFDAADWQQNASRLEALSEALRPVVALPGLAVRGLMTMAPFDAPEAELRRVFASLAALRAALASQLHITLPDLSMGMTDDYPIAIEEGATVIRVGRALFGERS